MYILEIMVPHAIIRGQFASRPRAENARRKVAKEMAKGKFRNSDDVIEIRCDTSTMSVRPSDIQGVNVVDAIAWETNTHADKKAAQELGILPPDVPNE